MATVTVMCKTPNGFEMEVNGVVKVINGWNSKQGSILQLSASEKVGITEGIPKDFWDAWRTKHASHPFVAGGRDMNGNDVPPIVSAQATINSAKAQAKENAGSKVGLEAIDPSAKNNGVEKETN